MAFDLQTIMSIVGLSMIIILTTLRSRKRLSKIDEKISRMKKLKREQSIAIRLMARESLSLRRNEKDCDRSAIEIAKQCFDLKGKIAAAEKVDRRVYVLDDRKTPVDQTWAAVVIHPNYRAHITPSVSTEVNSAWILGRRYIVWALDEGGVNLKIGAKLPKEKGFTVSKILLVARAKARKATS